MEGNFPASDSFNDHLPGLILISGECLGHRFMNHTCGKPACLSFEGQDCDQLQLDLRMLLSELQQYIRRPQISPQCHSGIEATCAVLDLRSNRFFQSVQHPDTGRICLIPFPWQFLRSVSRKTAGSRIVHLSFDLPCMVLLYDANLNKNNPKVNRARLGCVASLWYPLPER